MTDREAFEAIPEICQTAIVGIYDSEQPGDVNTDVIAEIEQVERWARAKLRELDTQESIAHEP